METSMKYPKVKVDKRKTITKTQVEWMRTWKVAGLNYAEIAKKIGCSYYAVYSRLSEKGRRWHKEVRKKYHQEWKKQKIADPLWRKKYQEGKDNFITRRYAEEPKFRKYMLGYSKSRYAAKKQLANTIK